MPFRVVPRIVSVDILRGLVMIIMALDHTRDFFSSFPYSPTDLAHTNVAMFFTRWITHFCAPVFVFLSGTSVQLSMQRGKSRKQVALQLFTRGIWLVFLELTVVRFGWMFNIDYTLVIAQVIWVIGWSMVILSALIFLPIRVLCVLSLVIIFGHNLLDGIHAETAGGDWWYLLHERGYIAYDEGRGMAVVYPLIPWVAVMSAGYCFGKLLLQPIKQRNKFLYLVGGGAILLWLVLRWLNIYGDPTPWTQQEESWYTLLSFLNCTKYPPSLSYLLMTLGFAILVMPLLEKINSRYTNPIAVYGKVPLFYYLLHIYLIHGMALLLAVCIGFPAALFTSSGWNFHESGWGFGLPGVYGFWLLAVWLLYWPCRWFMQVKSRYKKWWLSYL